MIEYKMTCKHCGKKDFSFSNKFCSIACHFFFYVKKGSPDECWEWQGTLGEDGRGRFNVGKYFISSHRYSYIFHHGEIPEGKNILHSCSNSKCVNPAHLRAGNQSENNKDMISQNRHPSQMRFPYFQKHSKETMKEVWDLRKNGISYAKIGTIMGIPVGTVFYLCKKAQGINYNKWKREKNDASC